MAVAGSRRAFSRSSSQESRAVNRAKGSHSAFGLTKPIPASFGPSVGTVLIASADGTAMLWLASIDDLLAEAARRIQRDPPIFTEEERRRFLIEE